MSQRIFVLILTVFWVVGCSANLNMSKDSSDKDGGEKKTEETLAAKLTSEDCTDPDLSKLFKGQTFMLCDGTIAEGTYEAPTPDYPDPANVLTTDTVNGVAGTYSPDFPDPASVLSTDTVGGVAGSMSSQGSWDLSLSFPGAGYFSAVSNVPTEEEVCSGTSVAGTAGSANCGAF